MLLRPAPSAPPPLAAGFSEELRNADFLARATNGFTVDEFKRLSDLGRTSWLEEQLHPTGAENQLTDQLLATLGSEGLTDLAYFAQYRTQSGTAARELGQATLVRAAHSPWQLRERMVDFWHDHFNVSQPDNGTSRLVHRTYDRNVIRSHVFGRFSDILLATAKSAAMLEYLNGNDNIAAAPNENYAREVMELHTLGVDGPFTETDITELARCLTGWTFWGVGNATMPGVFRFRANRHDTGSKNLLGLTIPAGGNVSDGETVLGFLASHPKTVDFVSRKLVRRFVSESAPETAVEFVKETWKRTGGDLREITAVLFSDKVANVAEPWNNRKVKRPFQLVIGLVRALDGTSNTAYRQVLSRLNALGQRPFYWPAPNGYPDSSAAWAGDLFGRWSYADRYARDNQAGLPLDDMAIESARAGAGRTVLAKQFDYVMTGGRMDPAEVKSVQQWADAQPTDNTTLSREVIGLLASSPSFQLA